MSCMQNAIGRRLPIHTVPAEVLYFYHIVTEIVGYRLT